MNPGSGIPWQRTHSLRSLSDWRRAATALLYCGLLLLPSGCRQEQQVTAAGPVTIPPVPITVATVDTRPVERRVSVVGSLLAWEIITVTPKIEGRVTETRFDVGDRVRAHDVLLRLDETDYKLAVDEAEKALLQELARLGLSQPPQPDFDIHRLPSVVRAEFLLQNARRQFERQTSLVASSAGVRQQLEQAETDLRVAEATLQQTEMDALAAIAAARYRESVLNVARQRLADTIVTVPELPQLQSDLPQTMVVAQRMVSVGEMVRAFPSTPVYELVLDDVLKLRVKVPERYASVVHPELQVEVTVEAYPGEVFRGQISRINPTVDPLNRTFEVEAQVQNQDHRLRHGGFAKAEVVLSANAQALTVPLEAVTRFAGTASVFRIRDNVAQAVEVQTGTTGAGWLEVVGDLAPGDVIATTGQSRLADGTSVQIREEL